MNQLSRIADRRLATRVLAWLALAAVVVAAPTAYRAVAQEETPTPPAQDETATPAAPTEGTPAPEEPTSTPGGAETVMRVAGPDGSVSKGDEFAVDVLVENVEHLATIEFKLYYDDALLKYERVEELAQFLESGEREVNCGESPYFPAAGAVPAGDPVYVNVACPTFGAPVCAGGAAGVAGDGLLSRIVFTALADGTATLELSDTTLLKDDIEPCSPEEDDVILIDHATEDATVEIGGSSDGLNWLLVGVVVGAVVVVIVVGGGIFAMYRSSRTNAGA